METEQTLHVTEEEALRDLEDPAGEYPPALGKALIDPFEYALGLRDGRIILFREATLKSGGKWVSLCGDGSTEMSDTGHHFPRGIDVRLSDIMWVADAPDGS